MHNLDNKKNLGIDNIDNSIDENYLLSLIENEKKNNSEKTLNPEGIQLFSKQEIIYSIKITQSAKIKNILKEYKYKNFNESICKCIYRLFDFT